MSRSCRFALSVEILALMAASRPRALTSEILATAASTNPVVVRRLIGQLSAAGLARAQSGRGGGAALARGPKKITLRAVYEAVEAPDALRPLRPPKADGDKDPAARRLEKAVAEAEAAFLAALEQTTLKDIAKKTRAPALQAPEAA